jgi:hypothetical protein
MNISQVFKDVLSYPLTDIKKFLTVLLLSFGSFLIIPIFMVLGYSLRIIKSTILDFDELPDFDNSGELINDGLKYFAANLLYGIPSYVVLLVLFMSGRPEFSITGIYSTLILAMVTFVVSILFILALANMAYEDRFNAIFDFKKIFALINKIGWGKYLSYLVVYAVIVELLTLAISLTSPYLKLSMGSILGLAVYFLLYFLFNTYLLMFGGRFRGIIYRKGIEDQNSPE